jgi:hypothetical protein
VSLERQLADYGKYLRQTIAELEVPMEPVSAVRPVPQEPPTHRSRWLIATAAGAAALVATALAVLFWPGGGESAPFVDGSGTVPTTLPASSTTAASTTTTASTTPTVPASALDGIVIYVTDGCADCPLLESTLRGLAGEVPVWVRLADGTMSLLPMVVVQFDGRVSGQWVGQVAVNSAEAIAAFAGARWPSGTMPPTTTTTTIPLTIVAAPIAAEDAYPCFPVCRLVAVSAREVWASMTSSDADLIGHLKDGVWAFYRFERLHELQGFFEAPGLAVAPDGTVWAATSQGVFSFEGGVGTRRFDGPASGVAVAPDGTVWAGGIAQRGNGVWLARWDGGSWVRVSGGQPAWNGIVSMAVSSDGAVWISPWGETDLLRYDGATREPVPVGDYPLGESPAFWIEAAPNGDLWIGGHIPTDDSYLALLARFDGEEWTTYYPPFSWSGGNIATGPDGLVFIARDDGLWSFDGTNWTNHLQGQRVWAVDVAPDGTVWYTDEQGVHTLGTP